MRQMVVTSRLIQAFAVALLACTALPHGAAAQSDDAMAPPSTRRAIARVMNDMSRPSEEIPHGVTASGWFVRPRVNLGNHAGKNGEVWHAALPWGIVYEAAYGSQSTNTRVEIKDLNLYFFSKQRQVWERQGAGTGIVGRDYAESLAENKNQPADVKTLPDGALAVKPQHGFAFHFFPAAGKATIDPTDIDGVFASFKARLVLDDPNGDDDRDEADYVACAGGDYWRSLEAKWDHQNNNDDIGIGRFKRVTDTWQTFSMTTLDARQMRDNPPPLN